MNFKFEADFIASPFGYSKTIESSVSAPIFVKRFYLNEEIKTARLYLATLGFGYVTINDKPLSYVMYTSQSDYAKTIWYDIFDISGLLHFGDNDFLAEVGNGFYNDFASSPWQFDRAPWRDELRMIAQIEIELISGKKVTIKSGSDWLVLDDGECTFNSIRNGEFRDFNKAVNGQNLAKKLKNAKNAVIYKETSAILRENTGGNVIDAEKLLPIKTWRLNNGDYVFEFEKNISGYAELVLTERKCAEITVMYGEQLNDDVGIDIANLNIYHKEGLFQTDKIVCSGGKEVFSPKHTYHGFRYMQISGLNNYVIGNVKAVFIHQDVKQITKFSCGNTLFNKIFNAAVNSSFCNMVNIVTDCPTREKLGWTGDLQMSVEQFLTNFDCVHFLKKVFQDILDSQNEEGKLPGIAPTGGWGFDWGNGPTFDAALFELPYQIYRYYSDGELLKSGYNAFKKYLDYLITNLNKNGLSELGLGDWSSPSKSQIDFIAPLEFTSTLYLLRFLYIMHISASLNGKDSSYYDDIKQELQKKFKEKYINADGSCIVNHQTALAFLLESDILDGTQSKKCSVQLCSRVKECGGNHECGIIGSRHILHALTSSGYFDIAYQMAEKTNFPSWGKWILDGQTNLCETWDGKMSLNHHMFSDIASWFVKCLAGVNLPKEGMCARELILSPDGFDNLSFAMAEVEIPGGKIFSHWYKNDGEIWWEINLPAGFSAKINLLGGYNVENNFIEQGNHKIQIKRQQSE